MYDEALVIVNDMHDGIADLVETMVHALQDRKVSPMEGIRLSMQGLQFASYLLTTLQRLTPDLRAEILYVLQHGDIVLPT